MRWTKEWAELTSLRIRTGRAYLKKTIVQITRCQFDINIRPTGGCRYLSDDGAVSLWSNGISQAQWPKKSQVLEIGNVCKQPTVVLSILGTNTRSCPRWDLPTLIYQVAVIFKTDCLCNFGKIYLCTTSKMKIPIRCVQTNVVTNYKRWKHDNKVDPIKLHKVTKHFILKEILISKERLEISEFSQ